MSNDIYSFEKLDLRFCTRALVLLLLSLYLILLIKGVY